MCSCVFILYLAKCTISALYQYIVVQPMICVQFIAYIVKLKTSQFAIECRGKDMIVIYNTGNLELYWVSLFIYAVALLTNRRYVSFAVMFSSAFFTLMNCG